MDAAVIANHRVAMFRDMGQVATEALARDLHEASMAMLEMLLRDGSYVGWLATDALGVVIAGAGVHVKPQLPRPQHSLSRVETASVPLVVNVYTDPGHRRRGISRALMQAVMRWATEQGFDRVVLHASKEGRALYESLGFQATNEMIWFPDTG
jgi:GNAT superfamily N-acetyltransferase